MKKPKIFDKKPENVNPAPVLDQVLKTDPQYGKIFSLLLARRINSGGEDFLELADKISGGNLNTEDIIKIADLGLLDKVQEIKERVEKFSSFLRAPENKVILEEVEKWSSGLPFGKLAKILGKDGLLNYLTDFNNCVAITINNPDVLEKIENKISSLNQIKQKQGARGWSFKKFMQADEDIADVFDERQAGFEKGAEEAGKVFLRRVRGLFDAGEMNRLKEDGIERPLGFKDLTEMSLDDGKNLVKEWAKDWKEAFTSGELKGRLSAWGKEVKKVPGEVLDRVRGWFVKADIAKQGGVDFGRELEYFKTSLSVDLAATDSYEDVVKQREKIEKKLFSEFKDGEPSIVDQVKEGMRRDWQKFLSLDPTAKKIAEQIRKMKTGKDKAEKKIKGLISDLQGRYLDKWIDFSLKQSGLSIDDKHKSSWSVLSVATLRSKIGQELELVAVELEV